MLFYNTITTDDHLNGSNNRYYYVPGESQAMTFSGQQYLLTKTLSQIRLEDVEQFIKETDTSINAHLFFELLKEVTFKFYKNDKDSFSAEEILLSVKGHPLALELLDASIQSVIGSMSGIATKASSIVKIATGAKYAYLGLRRGPMDNSPTAAPLIDIAAHHGGFHSAANIVAKNHALVVVGTFAHAGITTLTATFQLAKQQGTLDAYLKSIGFSEGTEDKAYENAVERDKNQTAETPFDLNDYVSFRAYIHATKQLNQTNPDAIKPIVLLVDTTSTKKGLSAAFQAAIDANTPITGIRLDTNPSEYIEDALHLYQIYHQTHPELFKEFRVYCTDGLNRETIQDISNKTIQLGLTNEMLIFGVGSTIANTKPLPLASSSTANQLTTGSIKYEVKLNDLLLFNGNDPATNEPFVDFFQADLYALRQWEVFNKLNEIWKEDSPLATINSMSSVLHFRHIKNEPYMIVAGVAAAVKRLNEFRISAAYLQLLKQNNIDTDTLGLKVGDRLEVSIHAMSDSDVANPYEPILSVEGHPGHVLLVESYLLSMIGSLSSVATEARKLCSVFDNETTDNRPYMVYAGLAEQVVLSDDRAYAAKIGGFNATTMNAQGVALYLKRSDCIYIPLNDNPNWVNVLQEHAQATNNQTIVLEGNVSVGLLNTIKANLSSDFDYSRLHILVHDPLASKENPKGIVYKTGDLGLKINGEIVHVNGLKGGGAPNHLPGVKTSVPGVALRSLLLKDSFGKQAKLMIDLALLSDSIDASNPDEIILFLKNQPNRRPYLYYSQENPTSGVLGNTNEQLKSNNWAGLFNLNSKFDDGFILRDEVFDWNSANAVCFMQHNVNDANKSVVSDISQPNIPVLIENNLFLNQCRLMGNTQALLRNYSATFNMHTRGANSFMNNF